MYYANIDPCGPCQLKELPAPKLPDVLNLLCAQEMQLQFNPFRLIKKLQAIEQEYSVKLFAFFTDNEKQSIQIDEQLPYFNYGVIYGKQHISP